MSDVVEVVDVEVEVVDDTPASAGSASVQYVPSGWALVTYTTGDEGLSYSVSVSPDGLIRLPHSLPPELGEAFVGAVSAASQVGRSIQEAAAAAPKSPGSSILNSPSLVSYLNNIVISEGKPPAGAVRLPSSSAPTQGRR